jgi:hypothetical protein
MTEGEWAACDNIYELIEEPVLECLPRKTRLYCVACCRLLGKWLHDDRSWKCLEAVERYADGKIKRSGLAPWSTLARTLYQDRAYTPTRRRAGRGEIAASDAVEATCATIGFRNYKRVTWRLLGEGSGFDRPFRDTLWVRMPQILRDIFGNPFRPVAFAPAWRSSAALELARTMYETRDFAGMPILADALEEAGCDDGDILAHCRDPHGVHVRGCWVVDRVLGKT